MKKTLSFLLVILFILTGCNSDNDFNTKEIEGISLEKKDHEIAEELVKAFSSLITNEIETRQANSPLHISLNKKEKVVFNDVKTRGSNTTIDSINLYIYDIEKNGKFGFAIATGDEITGQVYAYVENGSLSDTIHNESMAHMIRYIPAAIKDNIERYTNENSLNTRSIASTRIYGPHIKTRWHQKYPYNSKLPGVKCTYNLAGCATIAVAQAIIHYEKFPITYRWQTWKDLGIMYEGHNQAAEVGYFIKRVGDEIGVKYGCNSTGVTSLGSSNNALVKWGYITERKASSDVNMDKLKRSLLSNNLSIFAGTRSNGAGHIWLVDGVVYVPSTDKIMAVHCNFGWGGGRANGWYAVSGTAYNKPSDNPSQYPDNPSDGRDRFENYYCNNDYIYFYELNR